MDTLSPSQVRRWLLLSLLLLVVTAWFSVGYYHVDEHFQILEFCNFKLGLSPSTALPWEFGAKCRPALQPFIAFCLSKAAMASGCYNPFFVAFVLRLLMALLTWITTRYLVLTLLPDFNTVKGKKFFIWCSLFLWFVPYIGVRYSSENISANLFILAITLLLALGNYSRKQQYIRLLGAGLLFGFSLYLRLQIGFAFIGLGIWLIFIRKAPVVHYLLLAVAGLTAIGITTLVDRWFYGEWVFTPYNYFSVNIIHNVAAQFGVQPWWWYFQKFIELGIPPLSIALFILFLGGMFKARTHVFAFVLCTFLAGHFAIGHKELRFIFPVVLPFIYMVCRGLNEVFLRFDGRVWLKYCLKLFIIMNIPILLFKMVTPAQEMMKYYAFVYSYLKQTNATIVSVKLSPFALGLLEANYYKPPALNMQVFNKPADLLAALKQDTAKTYIFMSETLKPGPALAGCTTEMIYCQFPAWLLKYNVNGWQERSYIWAVFKVKAGK
ncbi:MAG: hypothetical protein H7257_01325 [Taibaiella sp.]|nr:hypothetical protein [Taibaiella sp.]